MVQKEKQKANMGGEQERDYGHSTTLANYGHAASAWLTFLITLSNHQPNPNTLTISSSTPVTTHDKVTASTMSHANESLLAHETKQGDTTPVAGMVDDVSKIRGAIPHAMGAPDSQDMRRAMPLALEDVEVGPIPFTAKLVSLLPCFLPCMACNSCYVLQPREEAAILHLGTRTERTERTERKECTLCTLLCTVYCTVYGA